MNAVSSAVALHLNQRTKTFLVPLWIAAIVGVVSVLIALIFWRSGSQPGSAEWVQGSQSNPGVIYALGGFLVYFGVASVATTYPFALTLGSTRRAFVAGTLVWQAIVAAYVAVVFLVLSVVELATNHWFVGFYVFDIHALGAGDPGRLLPTVFLGVLSFLAVGAVFAAAWVRFGPRGPQLLGLGVFVTLGIGLAVIIPDIAGIAAAFELWWLAIAAGAVVVLASLGTWLLLRSAVIR
ncbi:hypothetical protein Xcel_0415 [Xylanimonas cellulosilytica DSM 15894]|uniref:Uncharacterized protein n=1 Tax=Xylanimonas cellulosilytica (strain DSM 15894 / JCM 12276 / CECT 5975 / KCTC 9989 / LMG 20990 / NBRC 107835 / XIL07) TaxID=446471 RepID=D1BVI3_XYLCX|nr:hypothetical protein [Xylanimonas cellulosilytica]ACZ29454.1 hypothetical protein Xcel_0415 [Xylanimonas cellulosilytica DSM 15894]